MRVLPAVMVYWHCRFNRLLELAIDHSQFEKPYVEVRVFLALGHFARRAAQVLGLKVGDVLVTVTAHAAEDATKHGERKGCEVSAGKVRGKRK